MSYYCNNCGNIVEDLDGTGEFFKGREHGCCPRCHSEDVEEASVCELCGATIKPYEQFCDDCKGEIMTEWNNMVQGLAKKHGKAYETMEQFVLDFMEGEVF